MRAPSYVSLELFITPLSKIAKLRSLALCVVWFRLSSREWYVLTNIGERIHAKQTCPHHREKQFSCPYATAVESRSALIWHINSQVQHIFPLLGSEYAQIDRGEGFNTLWPPNLHVGFQVDISMRLNQCELDDLPDVGHSIGIIRIDPR